jgi:hypothetical protein
MIAQFEAPKVPTIPQPAPWTTFAFWQFTAPEYNRSPSPQLRHIIANRRWELCYAAFGRPQLENWYEQHATKFSLWKDIPRD